MNNYTPDVWVVLEFDAPELENPTRKVFAGWYGGFAGNNSWKLNSGIVQTKFVENFYEFEGYSGSTYFCHPNGYGMSSYMLSVLDRWLVYAESKDNMQIRVLDLDEVLPL